MGRKRFPTALWWSQICSLWEKTQLNSTEIVSWVGLAGLRVAIPTEAERVLANCKAINMGVLFETFKIAI